MPSGGLNPPHSIPELWFIYFSGAPFLSNTVHCFIVQDRGWYDEIFPLCSNSLEKKPQKYRWHNRYFMLGARQPTGAAISNLKTTHPLSLLFQTTVSEMHSASRRNLFSQPSEVFIGPNHYTSHNTDGICVKKGSTMPPSVWSGPALMPGVLCVRACVRVC